MSTTLNMTLLLRRAAFEDSCILAAGEPGFHTTTKELKIGDGTTTWAQLPFANEAQIEALIAAGVAEAKEYADGLAAGCKKLQTAVEKTTDETNKFVTGIKQNANGDITDVTFGDVDLSNYKTKQAKASYVDGILDPDVGVKRTITKLEQNENGEVTVTFGDIDYSPAQISASIKTEKPTPDANPIYVVTNITTQGQEILFDTSYAATQAGVDKALEDAKKYTDDAIGELPAPIDYTVTCEDEDVAATDSTPAFKRHVLKQLDGTVCTIDVPKDMVIADGRVEGDKLILVLNTGKEIEIEVADLIEYVTGDTADDGVITVSVDPTTHVVTAKINDKTITAAKFASDVDTYVDGRIDAKAKIKQTAYSATGDNKKTITSVAQNENGDISVTYSDIDFSHDHDAQYKKLQTPVEAKASVKNTFVDTIAQDANGNITVTEKAVDFSDVYAYIDELPHENTTYEINATQNPLEFTVTPSEGAAKTVTLVAPVVDTGVMSIEAGNDIVVTPGENGKVTIAHEEFATGEYTKTPTSSDKTGDVYMMTGVTVDNGHVTGANVQSLAHALMGMKFIFDGGTSAN